VTNDLRQLERAVDADAALLDHLPAVGLDDAARDRLRRAVHEENARCRRRDRWLRVGRSGLGVAAAAVLFVALLLSPRGDSTAGLRADVALDDWAAALAESEAELTGLLDGGWISGYDQGDDALDELDAMFDSFDASWQQFEEL
jgi:hypothetical protein